MKQEEQSANHEPGIVFVAKVVYNMYSFYILEYYQVISTNLDVSTSTA